MRGVLLRLRMREHCHPDNRTNFLPLWNRLSMLMAKIDNPFVPAAPLLHKPKVSKCTSYNAVSNPADTSFKIFERNPQWQNAWALYLHHEAI